VSHFIHDYAIAGRAILCPNICQNALLLLNAGAPYVSHVFKDAVWIENHCQCESGALLIFIRGGLLISIRVICAVEDVVLVGLSRNLFVLTQYFASFVSLRRELLNLGQQDALLPLLLVVDKLIKDFREGFLLFNLDFEIDVTMAVLGFTESHLVVKLGLFERLIVSRDDILNQFFSQLLSCITLQFLFLFSVLLCLLLEVLSVVKT